MSTRANILGAEDIPALPPQADTQAIAQQQGIAGALDPVDYASADSIARTRLGDDVVNRYGDVLGARPRKFTDFLRDFSINLAAGGDPTAATELHSRLRNDYEQNLTRALERDQVRRRLDLDTVDSYTKMLMNVKNVAKPFRKQYLMTSSEKIGIPMNKDVAAFYAQDTVPHDVLASPEFRRLIDSDPRAAVEQLTAAGVDLPLAMNLVEDMQSMRSEQIRQDQQSGEAVTEALKRRETKLSIRQAQLQAKKEKLEFRDLRRRFKRGEQITGRPPRESKPNFFSLPDMPEAPGAGTTPGGNTFTVRQ